MTNLDFKSISQSITNLDLVRGGSDDWRIKAAAILAKDREIIQTALRIADRLQIGDISDEMVKKSEEHDILYHRVASHDEIFKAMAKQLIKECRDDL